MAASSNRPRAFDAAHAHSWHYYTPRSNATTPAQAETGAHDTAPARPTHVRQATTPAPAPQPVFDAANPRTWNRSASRLLLEEHHRDRPTVRSVLDRPSVRTPTRHSAASRPAGDRSPRTLNDWSEYLASGEMTSTQERVAILTDVYRAMQLGSTASSTSLAQRRRPAPHRPPRSRVGTGLASMLHDPDFGDTSAYWSAMVLTDSNTRGNAHSTYPRRPGGSIIQTATLLSQQQQRRRRGSIASINTVNTTNSQTTLPEYDGGDWTLPDYRSQISSRGSMEINV
ncbi:hypothetical protein BCR37DRAFT_393197 [Protomyces lactucae-debilis]|uniref:Uncharacterized protein n=1 Tax=Protomyces lactucae-debilis TaxID=2754530 RepID=A0A1Y2FCH0_PROLT|nr:uncharacterized protein BCR37DRAFT_393197 [Protomyces lactucae-debilis]ORY81317.1 hypothetical protein BCR37DRAFT_393197 [Protomyces lactucae-debilis]